MQIIPVIDLKGGIAVHAKEGHRQDYRPLVSTLSNHPAPLTVIEGLLTLHPFKTLYLADLDALMGHPPQTGLIVSLQRNFPDVDFWIDQGLPSREDAALAETPHFSRVIGTESLEDENLCGLLARQGRFILSLDFMHGALLGTERILERVDVWPERIILMNLARVGSRHGPDFERIGHYMERFPQHQWVAAGGVRDTADLQQLASRGVSAVLMASALHDGRVDGEVIRRLAG